MALTSALHWWEESQLRVLVLSSLVVQWILFLSALWRRSAIPGWFRSIIWLAYLGSDALAIYALATLFNRHKNQDLGFSQEDSGVLEVVWAPILLMHLGGQDTITAYNIEDNELWKRHVFTSVSQLTVAIYVFCRSWRGGDKRLLQTAIVLFVPGVLKCLEKPWALKTASIDSLVSSTKPVPSTSNKDGDIDSLEGYVTRARNSVDVLQAQVVVDEDVIQAPVVVGENDLQARVKGVTSFLLSSLKKIRTEAQDEGVCSWLLNALKKVIMKRKSAFLQALASGTDLQVQNNVDSRSPGVHMQGERAQKKEANHAVDSETTCKLFVDLASSYTDRLGVLESFWKLKKKEVYRCLEMELLEVFGLLYTKQKMFSAELAFYRKGDDWIDVVRRFYGSYVRVACLYLPWAAIALFHHSHRETYDDIDVKITYALICCTAVLEAYSNMANFDPRRHSYYGDANMPGDLMGILLDGISRWSSGNISQYSLMRFFVRNKRHNWMMSIANLFGCRDWFMKSSCSSYHRIADLVLEHLKDGWKVFIRDVDRYKVFNDYRGHWTLEKLNQCNKDNKLDKPLKEIRSTIKRPFDESVLLWHMATDFCFYLSRRQKHQCAFAEVQTLWSKFREEVSFIWKRRDKEGSHQSDQARCSGASIDCKAVQCRKMSNYMMYLLFVNPEMLLPGSRRNLFTTANSELEELLKDNKPPSNKEGLIQEIKDKIGSEGNQGKFISQGWALAQALLDLGDEKKMWEVIEGVWVEMLCFSAGRCRGYLHAKALGTGGELLTYVWLLLSHMGMETLAERMQRTEFPGEGGDTNNAPSNSDVRTGATSSTSEVPNSAAAASSTSEISETRNAAGDEMV
ncbi:hypothetical protein ACP70R_005871 [Stipagrostis hirtigluma subsp. patula]